MRTLLLAFALLLGSALPASAQELGVASPRDFVAATYARYQAQPDVPPPDQSFAYSLRLRAYFNGYDRWQRRHPDLVGALDFDWWTNAQDYSIRNLRLTERAAGRGRRWVVARFDNYDRHDEVRFLFVHLGRRWYLDEVVQGSGRGPDGWTLTELLLRRER